MACIAVLALATFIWTPVAGLLGVVLLVLLAASAYDFRRARAASSKQFVSRDLPAVIGRDLPFDVVLTLTNETDVAVQGEVRDVAPPACRPSLTIETFALEAGGRISINQQMHIATRGRHSFGPVWLRVEGPWRLIDVQREVECAGSIRVLPETFASRDELAKDVGAEILLLDKITFARQQGAGTEFESLHPYRLGDDPRRIDWRASARYRYPIVRRHRIERHRDVVILIDCGRLMGAETDRGSKLDCAVDAGLNLARVALASGDRCGVGLFDDRVRGYLPPVSGVSSIRAISECIYDVATQWRESDFTQMFAELQVRQAKRALVVVISDVGDVETSRQFRAALVQLGRRHLVLFAALRTPLLGRIAGEEMHSLADGARKAVTFRLLRERHQALHALKRSGVHVVDVQPHELTLPLVNQFIELRQKNLL
jgi:uncharacterized protein (DUF58 family)